MLSPEQKYAFDRFKEGKNLFITGPGGTGKTRLIETFVKYMNEHEIKFQVCALTGCASVLLNKCKARTLHSWSGIGLANGIKETIIQRVIRNRHTVSNWKKVRVLIIDEVSMMSQKVFEIIETIGRITKKINKPFGGIQIIFTGDFFQLPPVGNAEEEDTCRFCFESEIWSQVFPKQNHIQLKTMFRQKDPEYRDILNQIRYGTIDSNSIDILKKYVGRTYSEECILVKPAKLFAVKAKTDFVNQAQYVKLEVEEVCYTMQSSSILVTYMDSGKSIENEIIHNCSSLNITEIEREIDYLKTTTNRVQVLKLKIGTRVMCLYNLDIENGICNGTQGSIIDWVSNTLGQKIPLVLFSNGRKEIIDYHWIQSEEYPCIGICQIPLCHSWAITIHKIQGTTLPMAEMDLGNTIFEYGQTYVALSRIESLSGLYLSAFHPSKIKANPIVKTFYNSLIDIDYDIETNIREDTEDTSLDLSCPKNNIFESFTYKEQPELVEEYIDSSIKRILL
jgi:ATP-dependent DNA helicase PIF1